MTDPDHRWNPRYVAYAKAHGREPEAQMANDCAEWPGAQMAGFMLWIQNSWREWRKLRGYSWDAPLDAEDHEDFDNWLQTKVEGSKT